MDKKSTKVLSGTMAAVSLISGVGGAIPVSAATKLDVTYKTAYDAVIKAKKTGTQEAIISARKAINQLVKEKELKGFVGEFSKQVDQVQQKLFEKFYSILFVNGKKKAKISQEEINRAREYVNAFDTYDGNKQYTASWTSAIDAFQHILIVEAHDSVVKVMTSKDAKDIEKAEKLVNVIAASTNKQTLDKSKELNAILNVIKKDIAQ